MFNVHVRRLMQFKYFPMFNHITTNKMNSGAIAYFIPMKGEKL